MYSPICSKCLNAQICDMPCAALETVGSICRDQDIKDKTALIRSLARQMGIRDAESSKKMRILASKIINRFPEFSFIREWNIKIGYVISHESKNGEKIVFADCRRVQEVFKAYLPYDFIITFYSRNTAFLDDNQQKILMLHELRHITLGEKGLKLRPHDIEDFKEILEKYGLDWNEQGKLLPDILAGE